MNVTIMQTCTPRTIEALARGGDIGKSLTSQNGAKVFADSPSHLIKKGEPSPVRVRLSKSSPLNRPLMGRLANLEVVLLFFIRRRGRRLLAGVNRRPADGLAIMRRRRH